MNDARLRLFELACEAAFLIATDGNPAAARQRFLDDLTDELTAGKRNMEAAGPSLRAAFRDAMGYSRRVPDAVGEESAERRDQPGSVRGSASRTSPGSSPTAPGEDTMVAHGQLRVIDGGES